MKEFVVDGNFNLNAWLTWISYCHLKSYMTHKQPN